MPTGARAPPARRGARSRPPRPPPPSRSSSPAGCSSPATATPWSCRARSASPCAVGARRPSPSAARPTSPRRSATPRSSPAPRPAPPSTSYDAWSCCSTSGAWRPPAVLRSGGLAVRDLKAVARELHVDAPGAALIVEISLAAGLIAEGNDSESSAVWLPTEDFDLWSAKPTAERWGVLVGAWLASSRVPSLVGGRDAAGKAWNALAPELSSGLAEEARRLALRVLAELPDGAVLATGTGVPSLVQRVEWLRPRRPAVFADLVAAALAEAAVLGRQRCRRAARQRSPRRRRRPRRGRAGHRRTPAPAGRPRAAPGRPHRCGARPAGDRGGPTPAPRGRRRVPRRCDRLPLLPALGPPRVRRRLVQPRGARLPHLRLPHAGPPAPRVPRRRRRPHVRGGARRARRVVPARRRRGRPGGARARPARHVPRPAAARADGRDQHLPPRRAPPAPAGDGRRPRRRGPRRHGAGESPRPPAGAHPPRPATGRCRRRASGGAGAGRGHRDPGGRPRPGHPTRFVGRRRDDHARPGRWPRCATRSSPAARS